MNSIRTVKKEIRGLKLCYRTNEKKNKTRLVNLRIYTTIKTDYKKKWLALLPSRNKYFSEDVKINVRLSRDFSKYITILFFHSVEEK